MKDLRDKLMQELVIPKKQAKLIESIFTNYLREKLVNQEEIVIPTVLKLSTKISGERKGFNFRTNKYVKIKSRVMPKCKFSSKLKDELAQLKVKKEK